ncbi:uncharacterized protein Bfra_004957 [Botrytis fragariae]|uniref:Uncharacterized protein n=1 Tax=Botrytis fragariae TaxID=1964551 RepID=A0A8H6EII4_9HELO|nr:uncharacterized protein Bfra_004957 [Botrytis fragariae]KAF5873496.1 hypothetical protein Bfra_004957 [Botrytis fragariae]
MAERTINEMFATYEGAVRGINGIKLQLMGGRPLHEPRPQLITYLPNDVNRYWEIVEDIEEHLGRYKFNNTSQHMDFVKAMRWYYEGGKEGFQLKAKDIYNAIAIYVPGTREEISRIKNDARMTFVVLTKRKRMIEGIELWYESQNYRQQLNPNPQDGSKSQLELHEEKMRARDAKDLGILYLTLLHGLNALIHSMISIKDPYKSAWNLKALNIRGQLKDLHITLSEKLTDLHKICERCGIEEEGSDELKEFKQMISRTFIKVLIHIDYFLIEISGPSMYRDTITNYIRERKSLNYVSEMKYLYAEESESYYSAWEPQFSRRMNAITNGIRIVTAVLYNGKSLLGIS